MAKFKIYKSLPTYSFCASSCNIRNIAIFLNINLLKVMKVIENNFYNQLYKIINNGERYFLNFVFSLRYFAHHCNRHNKYTNSHTHTHTHTRSHTLTYAHTHIHKQGVTLHISLWYFVRGRS